MKARQWMQIAAVASAIGLTGTAIANDVDRTSSDDSNAPQAQTTDQSRNGAMNRAAQLDSAAPDREATARPDASLNAGMNRAAQLGTSAPGAPTVEGGNASGATGAPNARMPSASVDKPSMGGESGQSGKTDEMTPDEMAPDDVTPPGRSEEATTPSGTSDDATLPSDDTLPGDARSQDAGAADGAIILPSDRFGAQPETGAPEPSNAQRERRLP